MPAPPLDPPVETVLLTLGEAAQLLDPPLTDTALRDIIRALGWQPAGYRHTGRAGKPTKLYPAADILRLHAALVPFQHRQ